MEAEVRGEGRLLQSQCSLGDKKADIWRAELTVAGLPTWN